MVKGAANGTKGRCVIVGLSADDLQNLLLGMPIALDMRQLGVEAELMLMGGATNESIRAQLASIIPMSRLAKDATAEDVELALDTAHKERV